MQHFAIFFASLAAWQVATAAGGDWVKFIGPHVSQDFSAKNRLVTDNDLRSFLAYQMGVPPSDTDGFAFAKKATNSALWSRPPTVMVFVDSGTDDKLSEETRRIEFSHTRNSMDDLVAWITSQCHGKFPLVQIDIDEFPEVLFVADADAYDQLNIPKLLSDAYTPTLSGLGLEKKRMYNTTSRIRPAETPSAMNLMEQIGSPDDSVGRVMMAMNVMEGIAGKDGPPKLETLEESYTTFDRLPETLHPVASLEVGATAEELVVVLTDAPEGVPHKLGLQKKDRCSKALFAELHLAEANMRACADAGDSGVVPLLCVFTPLSSANCFERRSDASQLAAYLFRQLASRLIFGRVESRGDSAVIVNVASLMLDDSTFSGSEVDIRLLREPKLGSVRPSPSGAASANRVLVDDFEAAGGSGESADGSKTASGSNMSDGGPIGRRQVDEMTDADREDKAITTQITLWVSIALAFAVAYAVYLTVAMTNVRDPLLYTKVAAAAQ